ANLSSFSTEVDTTCAICLGSFVRPRRLNRCGHVFCEECLKRQLRSAIKNWDLCAVCREAMV
ncbi:hypothetical protein P154DRAFT_391855, partial [Amniculicola lignicola CBS 123094]